MATTGPVGKHCILDLHGCPPALLDDASFVRETVAEASRRGVSTLLKLVSNRFEPQGVTVLGLLAESHISAHTWPEHGHVAIDIFACGEQADPERACHYLIERFEAVDHALHVLPRGEAEAQAAANPAATEDAVCQARS